MAVQTSPLVTAVIGCAIEVHKGLGPGLLESAYEECLSYELSMRGVTLKRQMPLPVVYKGIRLNCGYRVDLAIDNELIVEIKAVERVLPIHHAQVLTYLRLLNVHQGLLINFNVHRLVDGLKSFLL